MVFLIALGLIAGGLVPVQTSVNSRLRQDINEPFLASGISFLVGTLFLIIFGLFTGSPFIGFSELGQLPWWGYLGGVLATICLTANIFMFGELGSVLAIVLPMVGQIIFGILIDTFGWFGTQVIPLTAMKVGGAILVLLGIILIVVFPSLHHRSITTKQSGSKLFWEIGGIVSGMIYASEIAINGHVGKVLHSPIHAAFLTFLISTILLLGFVTVRGNITRLALIRKNHTPWWGFLGGIIGGFSIYLAALLVPQIGNGSAITLGILGQIAISLLIDTFGLLGGQKRPAERVQIIGLFVLIVGVVFTELL
ncbi:DMT family transporter [Limosilactobacillus sp. STM2_1]|uniref:DMT family transporter n=1 Tax=Limosilactobacillus rudii TaxID=2759755 RepID=A0A7W3UKL6_9LACO|nr:DMT family transporter [Limosilactobacillus rudii]MBB1079213.1 DMT family transporter [Limosilactobacillus rudii]MBB1097302.1 DMT family transporter [Limosilactobacillus rudii]MCD7134411.1 DMT family transporter [Limosilactobacillus rudii]